MYHLIKTEWKKMYPSVIVTLLLLTIISCFLTCTLHKDYMIQFNLDAWEVGTEYFSFLYPLFVVIPLCENLYHERKNNFLLYVAPRVSLKKYLTAKWIVYAISAFSILFVPYIISAFFAVYVNEPVIYENISFSHVLREVYIQNPILYALLLSCWKGIIGVLIMTFGFILAMYVKNIFLILTGPFLYSVLENFILSIVQLGKYRLVVSYDPTCISANSYNIGSIIVGPILLIVVTVVTMLFLKKVKGSILDTI